MADITMPQLGETVTEGTVVRWFKQVGDEVALDEALFEVSTDKVDTEVPSPAAGVLSEILANEGDVVEVGQVLARVGSEAAAPAPTPSPAAGAAARRARSRLPLHPAARTPAPREPEPGSRTPTPCTDTVAAPQRPRRSGPRAQIGPRRTAARLYLPPVSGGQVGGQGTGALSGGSPLIAGAGSTRSPAPGEGAA